MSNSESDYSSSSEEDEDYVPSGEDESGDELEGLVEEDGLEDVSIQGKTKTKGKAAEASSRRRKKWTALEDEGGSKDEEPEDEERLKFEQAKREEEKRKKEEAEKKKADDLWSSFMSDVKQKPKPKPARAQDTQPKKSVPSSETADDKDTSAPKAATSSSQSNGSKQSGTVKITKVFDFAGEEIKVTKEVNAASKEAKNFLKQQEEKKQETPSGSGAGPSLQALKAGVPSGLKRPGAGLGGVLGQIGKKHKISTLEKSKMDWTNFKRAEGIEEELKIHNKGKDGYVEKQKFLQRTDVKQYELERDLRLSTTKVLR